MNKYLSALIGCLLMISPLSISATAPFDWYIASAHVTNLEGTYLPGQFFVTLDTGSTACPAVQKLSYTGQVATGQGQDTNTNVLAVFSMVLKARTSHIPVWLYGYNTGCSVQYIGLN